MGAEAASVEHPCQVRPAGRIHGEPFQRELPQKYCQGNRSVRNAAVVPEVYQYLEGFRPLRTSCRGASGCKEAAPW